MPRASIAVLGALLALAVACSSEPSAVTGPTCPAGTRAVLTACAPVFDTCEKDEVSLPGGGCKRVGAETCTDGISGMVGIKGPPDWTCKPIGPPGVCPAGFDKVSGGWCEPLYHARACPEGTKAVVGQRSCQPLGDCGSGTWGAIKTSAATLYVDGAYRGGGSDGSRDKPFTTIAAALAQVKKGGHVAVAAGAYHEDLVLRVEGLTLEGRCARLVKVAGLRAEQAVSAQTTRAPAVTVEAENTTLRGLTITGPADGLVVQAGADGALIERVAVIETGQRGMMLSAQATLRDCLVRGTTGGIHGVRPGRQPIDVTVERVTVRDTGPSPSSPERLAAGLYFGPGVNADVHESLVLGTMGYGIGVFSGQVSLDRSVVVDTRENPLAKNSAGEALANGHGIVAQHYTAGAKLSLTLRDCLLKGQQTHGISIQGGALRVERTVIRDTRPTSTGLYGDGIFAQATPLSSPTVTVQDSLLTDNTRAGLNLQGAVAVVQRSVVRDTRPISNYGSGVVVGAGARLTMNDSLLTGHTFAGVYVFGASAQLDRVVIRDTLPVPVGGEGLLRGYGIRTDPHEGQPTRLTLRDSTLSGNVGQNLCVVDTQAELERSILRGSGSVSATSKNATMGVLVYQYDSKEQSELKLQETLVVDHEYCGIQAIGGQVTLDRSTVRGTMYTGESGNRGGYGLSASYGSVIVNDSLLSDNHSAGAVVSQAGTTLELNRSALVGSEKSLDGYGDGVLVTDGATITLQDSLVERSDRAGLLFDGTSGRVSRSVLRSAVIGVALKGRAAPTIDDDVVFAETTQDQLTSDLQTSRPPDIPPPPSGPGP